PTPAQREIRGAPWSLWVRAPPDHPSIKRGAARSSSLKEKSADSQSLENGDARFVLRVQRPRLTRAPEPPDEIAAWLEPGWDDPSNGFSIRETRTTSEPVSEAGLVKFAADPARSAGLQSWKLVRDEWAKNEEPAR